MKTTCIIFCFLISLFVSSQEEGDFMIGVNGNFPFLKSDKDIRLFEDGYEKYWESTIDQKFQSKGIPYGYKIIANYWMMDYFGLCFDYSFLNYAQQIKFNNGESRVFDFKVRNYFEGGFCIGNPNKFSTNWIFGVGTSTFTSIKYYKDGEMDMNYTSPINGVYSASGFSYRLDLNYKVSKQLSITFSYGGLKGSEYTDKSMMKGIDTHGKEETTYFPYDYAEYMTQINNQTSYDFSFDKIAKLKQSSFSIGVQYQFKLFNQKLNL